MQFKIVTVPLQGCEATLDELNTFLRSHRIVEVRKEFDAAVGWSFCVAYVDNGTSALPPDVKDRGKRQESERFASLTEAQRDVYACLKEARREIYQKEGISAYLVFTNIELMEIAQLPVISLETVSQLSGVKKDHIKKYGAQLLDLFSSLSAAPPTSQPQTDENVEPPF